MASRLSWLAQRRRKRELDDALARAARLGITPDRVLDEYRRIAFANLREIVEWSDAGMKFKADDKSDPDHVAAIAEIVESVKEHKPYRVKLYDKKAALDALARYLGMIPLAESTADDSEPTPEEAQHARNQLIDALDRLAAKAGEGSANQRPPG